MNKQENKPQPAGEARRKALAPAAERALAEAQERRNRDARAAAVSRPKEIDGRRGLEPVRYGDWEVKGIASDF